MKTPKSSNFEKEIARIVTEYTILKDQPGFLEATVFAITQLVDKEVKRARVDELMHISTDTEDKLCLCYFDEDGDCDRDITLEERIKELKDK